MENQTTPPVDQTPRGNESVPNATAALILGILSIVFCWCYGIVGLILGIVGLVMANKGRSAYELEPHRYSESSYNNLKAGRITSIIGIILGVILVAAMIIFVSFFPDAMNEYREQFEQMEQMD